MLGLFLLPLLVLPDDGPAPSVEELIRICRERSARHREELAARVDSILAASDSGGDSEAVQALLGLGPEAGRFLLPHLDPPEGGGDRTRSSRLAAEALIRLAPAEARGEVLRILRGGSPHGRIHAARVLGAIGGEEAATGLLEALGSPDADLRRAAIEALGRMRHAAASGRLAVLLSSADASLVRPILLALRSIANPDAVPAVAIFLDSGLATPHLGEALDYLVAVKGKAALPSLLRLLRSNPNAGNAILLLRATGGIAAPGDRDAIAALREFVDEARSRTWDVRAEAAVALSALGEEGGAKGLLREYHAWISNNSRLPGPYAERGGFYLRLGRWGEALRDYQEAIRLAKNEGTDARWFVDAARALCRLNREREAVSFLKRSGLSPRELARYRDLPEFEELRRSEKYRDLWED
ncbi:MAG: HEAT repeat domain-containing protein [Planctomycetes bacterium]|nr:HEAT repeat domain-containing protein [Planctomycetota bacterium]